MLKNKISALVCFALCAALIVSPAKAVENASSTAAAIPTEGNVWDETITQPTTPTFLDISNHWAAEYINKAVALGLFLDNTEHFRPDEPMTRAECITILWHVNGAPQPKTAASFTDLDQDWYQDAVAWAQESGVVNGIGNGLFDPYSAVTREQLATLLHRIAGSPTDMGVMFSGVYDHSFSDSVLISSWAKKSLYWSIFNVFYCGVDSIGVGTELNPTDAASRAQIAVMVTRYLEEK